MWRELVTDRGAAQRESGGHQGRDGVGDGPALSRKNGCRRWSRAGSKVVTGKRSSGGRSAAYASPSAGSTCSGDAAPFPLLRLTAFIAQRQSTGVGQPRPAIGAERGIRTSWSTRAGSDGAHPARLDATARPISGRLPRPATRRTRSVLRVTDRPAPGPVRAIRSVRDPYRTCLAPPGSIGRCPRSRSGLGPFR
jgi:hypothetical protein